MTSRRAYWPGAPLAIASAALFGASTPFAKILLGSLDPWLLAAILYLGAGLGLGVFSLARRHLGETGEAPLGRHDLPWLAGIVVFGGMLGPVFLMLGLSVSSASATSLLLNLEGLATMAIAWVVFRENVDRRLFVGAICILAGSVVLTWQGEAFVFGWGGIAIAAACLCWGIDNNLTRKLSAADPVLIAAIKGIVAGAVNLGLALSAGALVPAPQTVAAAAILGLFGYGVSLVIFILALRHLGTARTGAYYSTAPFIGAAISVLVLGDPLTIGLGAAALLMGTGVWLHLSERHEHAHTHEGMGHDHRHVHDEHHRHDHGPGDPPGEPHSHRHVHPELAHRHAHYPDLHHRHDH